MPAPEFYHPLVVGQIPGIIPKHYFFNDALLKNRFKPAGFLRFKVLTLLSLVTIKYPYYVK
jgi:hypothetical protein